MAKVLIGWFVSCEVFANADATHLMRLKLNMP